MTILFKKGLCRKSTLWWWWLWLFAKYCGIYLCPKETLTTMSDRNFTRGDTSATDAYSGHFPSIKEQSDFEPDIARLVEQNKDAFKFFYLKIGCLLITA